MERIRFACSRIGGGKHSTPPPPSTVSSLLHFILLGLSICCSGFSEDTGAFRTNQLWQFLLPVKAFIGLGGLPLMERGLWIPVNPWVSGGLYVRSQSWKDQAWKCTLVPGSWQWFQLFLEQWFWNTLLFFATWNPDYAHIWTFELLYEFYPSSPRSIFTLITVVMTMALETVLQQIDPA